MKPVQPKRTKPEHQFRAVKWKDGSLALEVSLDGRVWEPSIVGLNKEDVQRNLDKLHRGGKKVRNTSAFKFTPSTKNYRHGY